MPMEVSYEGGDRFTLTVRGHDVVMDQPRDVGGEDDGATPTELFIGTIAACVGFYAERFLRRHDLSPEGLRIEVNFDMAEERPARVRTIDIRVVAPSLSEERRTAFERVIDHCTLHNTLRDPPQVHIDVVEPARA